MHRAVKILTPAALIVAAASLWSRFSVGTVVSGLLTAIALVAVREGMQAQTRARGILTIAWLYWGLSYVSNLIEALVFHVIPLAQAEKAAAFDLVVALAVAALIETLTRREKAKLRLPQAVFATGLAWRIPLLAICFFIIYIAAGIAIQPWIMSFYAHRPLPSLRELLGLQFCRGLLDISCIYAWYRQWALTRRRAAWLSAYVFAVLCGWGPLLLPNQYMPARIRAAHAVEMGFDGILFGIATALTLLKARSAGRATGATPLPE